jgi:rod shape-determining protein MreD
MIMPRGTNQLLLPVNPFFIALTLLLALGSNLLPLGRHPAHARPAGAGAGVLERAPAAPRRRRRGLRVRPADGRAPKRGAGPARAGLHPAELRGHQRAPPLLWFGLPSRRCSAAAVPGRACGCRWWCAWLAGGMFPGWELLLAPLFEALLWPLVTALLLAPQRRAPDPDENRPL